MHITLNASNDYFHVTMRDYIEGLIFLIVFIPPRYHFPSSSVRCSACFGSTRERLSMRYGECPVRAGPAPADDRLLEFTMPPSSSLFAPPAMPAREPPMRRTEEWLQRRRSAGAVIIVMIVR